MKVVVVEPLGIKQTQLQSIIDAKVQGQATIIYYDERSEEVDELIKRCEDADIVVLSNVPFPRSVLQRCVHIKAIMVAFTGVDHIDMECCRERAITVCNCAGYSTSAVADIVFGMLISFYRNLSECDKRSRTIGCKDGLIGYELEGKKFGIIGTGAIGTRVAMIANAFGCDVYAYSRTLKALPNVQNTTLDEVLSTCDIISLHVPYTPQSKHMIGEWELKRMKEEAILINTARGPIVDNDALAQALMDGEIAGACIDVLDSEPPFDETLPILQAPNTIITPHIGFASKQAMVKRAHMIADNLQAYLQGNPIHIVK